MRTRLRRSVLVLTMAALMLGVMAVPVGAGGKGAIQLSSTGYPGTAAQCPLPSDFPIYITGGNVEGCLYQTFGPGTMRPSGTYLERGTEVFVGCIDGIGCGSFDTTFTFTAKFLDGDFNKEIWGRCQHPIVPGTGSGDFVGATGRFDFKDVLTHDADGNVIDAFFPLRGHIRVANGA